MGEQQQSSQACVQYVWTGAELLGISAGHCTRLEAVGRGHLSAASRHRQRLGTFYPWPMFSINPDNVLLTLRVFFFWKSLSITGELFALLSPEGMNRPCIPLLLLLLCECRPASGGITLKKVKKQKREGNIMLTRFIQWLVPAKQSASSDKLSYHVLWDP